VKALMVEFFRDYASIIALYFGITLRGF